MRRLVLLFALGLNAGLVGQVSAQTDSTATRHRTIIPFPFYFYSPETKSGGGVAISVLTRDRSREENRPNNYALMSLYTEKGQFLMSLGADVYRAQERDRFEVGLSFADFPNIFYGLGPNVDKEGEDYTATTIVFRASASRKLANGWRLGPNLFVANEDLSEIEADGLLDVGVRGSEGGAITALGFAAERDGRDNVSYARRSTFLRAECAFSVDGLGSDYSFGSAALDGRSYRSRGPFVVALRASAKSSFGAAPFQALPGFGSDTLLRGYDGDRFRDHHRYVLQSELRLSDWHRLGMVVFADAGSVAHEIGDFSTDTIRSSYGLGLRILLSRSERLHIRADMGFGDDGSDGFYLNLGEVF